MGGSVKSHRKVQEDKETNEAIVGSCEEVFHDFDEGGLRDVVGSEARLEGFKELMVGHVLLELSSCCSFQNFIEEGKVGDRAVVAGVIRVQTRLFKCGDHHNSFEAGGDHP